MKTPAACSPEDPDDDEFYQQVYNVLRQLTHARSPDYTLQVTALLHEAWLRMGREEQLSGQNGAQFLKAAAEAMRRILVDRAYRWNADRHGKVPRWADAKSLENASGKLPVDDQLLQLNQALEKLQEINKQKAELVKLRIFLGMSFEQMAEVMGISVSTTKRWWNYARAWLRWGMSSQ